MITFDESHRPALEARSAIWPTNDRESPILREQTRHGTEASKGGRAQALWQGRNCSVASPRARFTTRSAAALPSGAIAGNEADSKQGFGTAAAFGLDAMPR